MMCFFCKNQLHNQDFIFFITVTKDEPLLQTDTFVVEVVQTLILRLIQRGVVWASPPPSLTPRLSLKVVQG